MSEYERPKQNQEQEKERDQQHRPKVSKQDTPKVDREDVGNTGGNKRDPNRKDDAAG